MRIDFHSVALPKRSKYNDGSPDKFTFRNLLEEYNGLYKVLIPMGNRYNFHTYPIFVDNIAEAIKIGTNSWGKLINEFERNCDTKRIAEGNWKVFYLPYLYLTIDEIGREKIPANGYVTEEELSDYKLLNPFGEEPLIVEDFCRSVSSNDN